jgi:hypothetical protein
MAGSSQQTEARFQANPRVPTRHYLIGAVCGLLFWGLSLFGAFVLETYESSFPEWVQELDLVDTLGSVCMIIGAPVVVGGFAFLWGDDPPFQWLGNTAFHFCFGIVFYALVGARMGAISTGLPRVRFSMRTLFLSITAFAIAFATSAWLDLDLFRLVALSYFGAAAAIFADWITASITSSIRARKFTAASVFLTTVCSLLFLEEIGGYRALVRALD